MQKIIVNSLESYRSLKTNFLSVHYGIGRKMFIKGVRISFAFDRKTGKTRAKTNLPKGVYSGARRNR
jgi:hypothetical protein